MKILGIDDRCLRGICTVFCLMMMTSGTIYGQHIDSVEILHEQEYEKRIQATHLNGHYIPADLDDAMRTLDELVPESARANIRSLDEEAMVRRLYFGFGKWLSVNWGFYDGSRYTYYLKGLGLAHPDDVQVATMIWYHRHVHGGALEVEKLVGELQKKRRELHEQRLQKILDKSSH